MSLFLKALREAEGISQTELGSRIGVKQGQIAKLERPGRRLSMDWIARLAPAFGMSVEDFAAKEAAELTEIADGADAAARYADLNPGAPPVRPFPRDRLEEHLVSVLKGAGMSIRPGEDPWKAVRRTGLRARPTEDGGFEMQAVTPAGKRLLLEMEQPGSTRPDRLASAPDLPVMSLARCGADQEMYLQDGPVDWARRPAALATVKDSYAVYAAGDSMRPRYRPGQLLFVNPHRPPRPEDGVVVVKSNHAVLVKEWVRSAGSEIWLREYFPEPREFAVPAAEIETIGVIVGTQDV